MSPRQQGPQKPDGVLAAVSTSLSVFLPPPQEPHGL